MARRALLGVVLVGATAFAFVPSASAWVCPGLTQPQHVYHPFTRERVATICVPIQH